jgi:tRNA A37 methylthiotransferase MiaB
MNVNDSEIVRSVLQNAGHIESRILDESDLVLTNTCSIRENAEAKIWHRLQYFRSLRRNNKRRGYPKVAVLGCMAERLKDRLLDEEEVDIVCG